MMVIISLNKQNTLVVCHGIPNKENFKPGDIMNLDITMFYKGMHTDTSAMATVGEASPEKKRLISVAQKALYRGIKVCKPGNKISMIGEAIEKYVRENDMYVVKEFCGHGIGTGIHMNPIIRHFKPYPFEKDITMKKGMVFTIEPIVSLYSPKLELLKDGWTVLSRKNPSALFEHTVLINDTSYEILTKRKTEIMLL